MLGATEGGRVGFRSEEGVGTSTFEHLSVEVQPHIAIRPRTYRLPSPVSPFFRLAGF